MDAAQVERLGDAAADGVDFDGLSVRREGEDYVFDVAGEGETVVPGDEIERAATEYADYVTNWDFWHASAPRADDRFAFLRWIERADAEPVPDRYDALAEGVTREWGQLRITARLGEHGRRRYELRHVDDAEVDGGEPGTGDGSLDDHDDPLDAREIAKRDDDGRYRPLKTAPSLRRGWRFPELNADELVRAVDCFYPATIANWHLEREGDLDVSHWRATAERQTGIYDVISELPDEAVGWMAEACCVDSQCCKRREWDLDEDEELDVPRGDGAFPCREPCSVVIAAARKFTTLESEESRTYELELTLSELNQLTEIVDAVADGTVDQIREADVYDGANRYRARYLRAKRFDDEGGLAAERVEDRQDGSEEGEE